MTQSVDSVEQALQRASILVHTTIGDDAEKFNATLPDTLADAYSMLLALAGIASHLAWMLDESNDAVTAQDCLAVATFRALKDYQDYLAEEEHGQSNS